MDNVMDYFGLTKEDLLGAKAEAQSLASDARSSLPDSKRVDVMMWLQGLEQSQAYPNLSKLEQTMGAFGGKMNSMSQVGDGDRTKRIDKMDF